MIYIFSFVASRHRWVMWLFLVLRWFGLAALGSPLLSVGFVAVLVGAHPVALLLAVFVHCVVLFNSKVYSRHRRIILFKRRWPVLWAQVQRKQLLDHDDAHLQRPWMAAPKIGFIYKIFGSSVSLSVRPAVGQTLIDLQGQAAVIAAQTGLVDMFEVECLKASSHRGRLKIMFNDRLAETQVAENQNVHTV